MSKGYKFSILLVLVLSQSYAILQQFSVVTGLGFLQLDSLILLGIIFLISGICFYSMIKKYEAEYSPTTMSFAKLFLPSIFLLIFSLFIQLGGLTSQNTFITTIILFLGPVLLMVYFLVNYILVLYIVRDIKHMTNEQGFNLFEKIALNLPIVAMALPLISRFLLYIGLHIVYYLLLQLSFYLTVLSLLQPVAIILIVWKWIKMSSIK